MWGIDHAQLQSACIALHVRFARHWCLAHALVRVTCTQCHQEFAVTDGFGHCEVCASARNFIARRELAGRKDDDGKPRTDLLSAIALEGTACVLAHGAKKYGPHNWRRGIKWSRLIAALLRHTFAFMRGEDLDPETGLPHLDHMSCCVTFLQEFFRTRADLDDRYKEPAK